MPREPERVAARRGRGRPKKVKEEPAPVYLDDDDESDPEDADAEAESEEDADLANFPENGPDPVQSVPQGASRAPTIAEVEKPFQSEGAQNLNQFVERFAERVERDPENHWFEIFRVKPKVDSDGNPCEGYAASFHRGDLLTYEYLQQRLTPGLYTLCFVGINSRGVRKQWLGVLNGLRIAKRTFVEEDSALPPDPRVKTGGNGRQPQGESVPVAPFVQWGRPAMSGEQLAQAQAETRESGEKVALASNQLLRESLERADDWAKTAVAQAQRPAITPPSNASSDPQVTTKALELLSDAAKAGPREQSLTEQRLLEQINALRDDLAKLQSRHVDELSKLRTDHVQELFKERDESAKARGTMSESYERSLEAERRRGDELRSNLTTQHQAFISNLEAQQRAHTEAVRASLEARSQSLTDQLTSVRDELSRTRTEMSGEISRLRSELSEEKSRSMTGQHDLVLAKVEAKTAEVHSKMAGDSLSGAGKMLASVKGFAEALGYAPAVAVSAAPEESGLGTIGRVAGAAQSFFASEGFAKLAEAAASRLRSAGTQLPAASPSVTAASVAAYNAFRADQRQTSALPPAQPVPPVPQIEQVAPSPVAQPSAGPPPGVGSTQDGIEDAALMGETPESFVAQISTTFQVDVETLRSAVAGASDTDVWGFLQVNPTALSVSGREFAASVLAWLRAPVVVPAS